jgi:hypothetical protein
VSKIHWVPWGTGTSQDRDEVKSGTETDCLGMGLGLSSGFPSTRQTEPKVEVASVCPNRTDIWGKPKTFFFFTSRDKMSTNARGGTSSDSEEET